MKQFLLPPDAVALIETLRENTANVKSSICDAFANTVFNASAVSSRPAAWQVLTTLQEYAHLIDALTNGVPQSNQTPTIQPKNNESTK